ncbi:MAG: bifunctional diaminohydroxyphosphoribosylaminopyrimidine deaminase/5-amino-6-(5-phosphoribosylamino)uracil reductase RibD [Synergistaceae bacterium]|nr:bifunctional diaminohydroxyphosphoribosylaminopyrimidine deaminase/5-amino-6-(5-phosphoribosylamino)uracil reductase RibD [Synergistaceae bacterium]
MIRIKTATERQADDKEGDRAVKQAEQRRIDEHYMRIALSLAMRGTGSASPNPRVGAVIVRDGEIIGSGWHRHCGGPHAEVAAVDDAGGDVRGATVYVNLEPCCHYGKTPPCAQMLIEHGVSRVVAGITDPNPVVNCGGVTLLDKAGIEVTTGVLEDQCRWINRGFIRRMTVGRPWVMVKSASSLDGDIALEDGSSKWVTGPESREKVHMLRAESDALLTGIGTILADDPELSVRNAPGRTPLRVVLDSMLRTPPDARILESGNTLFFAGPEAPEERLYFFRGKGAEVEIIDTARDRQIEQILLKLCEKGVNYLMVEAGAKVTSAFFASGSVDEFSLFIAPKLMGNGIHYTEQLEFAFMENSISLKNIQYSHCGDDLWIKGVLACSPDL